MGYYLRAFICKSTDARLLTNKFDKAVEVKLTQGLSLIPMIDDLFDQMNGLSISPSIAKFDYLTNHIERGVLDAIGDAQFIYLEAEYFGGEGGQMTIIWKDNKRERISSFGQGEINEALRSFGIIADNGEDEFQTLGLGHYRNTNEWLNAG